MFKNHQRGAAPFATEADALNQAESAAFDTMGLVQTDNVGPLAR